MALSPFPAALRAAAPGLSAGVAVILRNLAALVASGFLRHPRHVVHIVPLWNYIGRTMRRLDRVMARLAAGTLRPSRPRSGPVSPRTPSAGRRVPEFPRTRAWLVAGLGHHAAGFASQLDRLLAQPGHAELVAATPQAQRLLRPLCHYLGIRPACLARPRPPAPPRRSARPAAPPVPDDPAAFAPAPPTPLCPRLLRRWPWVPHPGMRTA